MRQGPTIVRECSACGKFIAQRTIMSGNTLGARFWTDGKRDAPMLPEQPKLVKCQHCVTFIWLDEQNEVGEIQQGDSTTRDADRFADARQPLTPTLKDYATFLEGGVSDKEKERYARLRAWWAGNDSRRESGKSTKLDTFETENLRALLTLLDEAEDHDRIVKAEALRELGEFVDAEILLAKEFDDELSQAGAIIRALNQGRITAVAEMKFD